MESCGSVQLPTCCTRHRADRDAPDLEAACHGEWDRRSVASACRDVRPGGTGPCQLLTSGRAPSPRRRPRRRQGFAWPRPQAAAREEEDERGSRGRRDLGASQPPHGGDSGGGRSVSYREEGPFYQQPTPPRGDEVELMDRDAPSLLPMVCFQTIHGSTDLTMLVERDWQRVSRRPDTRNSARSCTC